MTQEPASNGCSQPQRLAPKWGAPTRSPPPSASPRPMSHNHCATVLVRDLLNLHLRSERYHTMLSPTAVPLRPRALVVDHGLAKLDTALGRAAESLAAALEARNGDVVRALSLEDGQAIVGSDASLRAVLLDWNSARTARARMRRP